MSKIKAVRFINLNYNNNTMKIDDETFDFQGESTLLALRNGGGKSVLVQMLMAPFMSKGRRNLKERLFESYFTTNRPTFILVEWMKDHGAGFVLTGMMVRKRQDNLEEMEKEPLEVIQFIHEYKEVNPYDLKHFPVVELAHKGKTLKSFNASKQLFETLKKEPGIQFNYYDMTQSHQARRYFEHLKENQIHQKEWESIIKRINLKESGLSELFSEAKNETLLVEKWFLKVVHDKLNKEEDKITRFTENLTKYIKQYKANTSKISRKVCIEAFKEDAKILFEEAYAYKEVLDERVDLTNQIANLRETLIRHIEGLREQEQGQEKIENEVLQAIEELKYEALCIQIYEQLEKEEEAQKQLDAIACKGQDIERQSKEITCQIEKGECAKLYTAYQSTSKEVQDLENALSLLNEKEKDLTPEKNNLGYTLKLHYKNREEQTKKQIQKIESGLEKDNTERQDLTTYQDINREKNSVLERSQGSFESKIKAYDELEGQYNKKHHEAMRRNIMGHYEKQLFYNQKIALKQNIAQTAYDIAQFKNKKQMQDEQEKVLQGQEKDLNHTLLEREYQLIQKQERLKLLEEELQERKELIKYVALQEDRLFDEGGILQAFNEHIERLREKEREQALLYDKEKEAYEALKSGKVLKLSKAMEEAIEALGIHKVYGMEWLKKNGYSEIQNAALVEANPFIPYALIMTQKEMLSLKNTALSLYTEIPIPIIKREDLEGYEASEKLQVYEFNKVNFLVAFNQGLLNEVTFAQMLGNQLKKLQGLEVNLKNKKEEIHTYQEKKSKIAHQVLTKEHYEETQKSIEKLIQDQETYQAQLDGLAQKLKNLQEENINVSKILESKKKAEGQLSNQYEDLDLLEKAYEAYGEYKESLAKVQKELHELGQQFVANQRRQQDLEKEIDEMKEERNRLNRKLEEVQSEYVHYAIYKEGTVIERDIEDIESRYKSIVENLSRAEKDIEQQLKNARVHFKAQEEELIYKAEEYELKEESYKYLLYDRFEEKQLKGHLKIFEQKLKDLQSEIVHLSKDKGAMENQLKSLKETLEKRFRREIKPKEQLTLIDFEMSIREKEVELASMRKKKKELQDEIRIYDLQRIGMMEFKDLVCTTPLSFRLDRETIELVRGEMVRDYRTSGEMAVKKHNELSRAIAKMLRREEFTDEFFKVPLETLEKIAHNPEFVIENLSYTIEAYNTLMIKLQADIALIEKEKQSVIDSFIQYISEIHEHIGKIDKNSNVTIQDKSVKMLKIELPDWKEQEKIYVVRLKDLIESITSEGIERLGQNENIEELVSKRITTKNLYNEVVGVSQVGVKLYKIEEERVYQITWDEVAKNSGGEGFLSAFVILSSLLSYMRRDETDLWGEKESGKVLIMDNPFAQTNASHLLKPLMDMANKRNTQLICLSGLNGESIYNRFDNIYVLNLVASRLSEGMKYLKSEHIRGEELVEELVSVQIQTEDINQMTLF